jgi:hypothetical protein
LGPALGRPPPPRLSRLPGTSNSCHCLKGYCQFIFFLSCILVYSALCFWYIFDMSHPKCAQITRLALKFVTSSRSKFYRVGTQVDSTRKVSRPARLGVRVGTAMSAPYHPPRPLSTASKALLNTPTIRSVSSNPTLILTSPLSTPNCAAHSNSA